MTDNVFYCIGEQIEERRQLTLLGFGKRTEDMTDDSLAFGFATNVRTTDPTPNPQVVRPEQP